MNDIVLLLVPALGVILALTLLLFAFRPRKRLPSAAEQFHANEAWAERRRLDAERTAENARPYDPEEFSPSLTELSLIEYHHSYRDETYAAVYLLPGRVILPGSNVSARGLFAQYWDMHGDAIWSWRDDNLRARLSDAAVTAAAHGHALNMREALTAAGWRITGRDAYSEALRVTYLSR